MTVSKCEDMLGRAALITKKMQDRLFFSIYSLSKKILQILLDGLFFLTSGGDLSILGSVLSNEINNHSMKSIMYHYIKCIKSYCHN